MKRKADDSDSSNANNPRKKKATEEISTQHYFRAGLFASETVNLYTKEYTQSKPYKHAVVSNLIDDSLLRSVRSEILENIHFTPKETDIYKIHQSGDLANLDGLPESALDKLPSLLKLRDALYSNDFRQWLTSVTGAGSLSGKKTDMAVNVYVPGCHLLCHDDVIGTRRVSYILYLTNPDMPWDSQWGGALRLYPTEDMVDESKKTFKVPNPAWSAVIPPAWNQLAFFAVQPGESFHDVEEVYETPKDSVNSHGGRFRMAISGWFHIPQEAEDGFEPGLEARLAEKSSLQQLQGKAAQFDLPQLVWQDPEVAERVRHPSHAVGDSVELSETDLEFLLKYLTPNYLTPDTVEELNEMFAEESTAQLTNFLNPKFAARLSDWFKDDQKVAWQAAKFLRSRPPHKHRYEYISNQPSLSALAGSELTDNPFELVLNDLLPSLAFRKWLSLVTGLELKKCAVLARRFRHGLDYELAQSYEGEDPQLEYCLCITPTSGWGGDDELDDHEAEADGTARKSKTEDDNVGGYEIYMAGEDPDDEGSSDDGVEIPAKMQSHTGAGDRRNASRKKADPAIYSAAADDEDDGILVSNPASWNSLSLVLRDKGTLRFVKYVSQSAPGDRWDFAGCVEVEPDDESSETAD